MIEKSGRRKIARLKVASGSFSSSASLSIFIPNGRRPLVMVKRILALCSLRTAARVRAARRFYFVTKFNGDDLRLLWLDCPDRDLKSVIDAVSLKRISLLKQLGDLLCDSSECMINRGIATKINLSWKP